MKNLKTKYKLIGILFMMVLFAFMLSTNSYAAYSNNLIPTMTSNTSPSGIASASSNYGVNYDAWRAFDKTSTMWGSSNNTFPQWIAYEFNIPKAVSQYTIKADNWSTTPPYNWTFEGSNDGTTWTTLDTRTNITGWSPYEKRTFSFANTTSYKKYRLYMTANNGGGTTNIDEIEMMESLDAVPSAPANLIATAGDAQASLTWSAVYNATSYNVKRATAAGGPYTTVETNVYAANYTNTGLTNGVTYYYVVTTLNANGESSNSNEVSVTPQQTTGGNRALLVITMINGTEKEYDLSSAEISAFTTWYDNRANGTGPERYTINKTYNKGPFLNRKDNIVFDKILYFEVNEY